MKLNVNDFIPNINENNSLFLEDATVEVADRGDFVHNVGVLASQTREGVEKIEYFRKDDEELAIIFYKKSEFTKKINIRHNSFTAIVRDIFSNL